MSMFHQFSYEFILGLNWETLNYWIDRATEIKTGKIVPFIVESKVDDETFEKQRQALYNNIERIDKLKEGTVNG